MATCQRPDILYLVHRVPYPPDKGDRIRGFELLRYLSRRADVHLACLADEPVEKQTLAALGRYARRVAVMPLGRRWRWVRAAGYLATGRTATEGAFSSAGLRAVLRQWAAATRFDAALASASSMVPYLRAPELRAVPAVVDLMDVDSQKWLDYAAAGRGLRAYLHGLEGRRLRRLEQSLPGWVRALTLVSEAEVDLYRRFNPTDRVWAVGNGTDLDYFRPGAQATEPSCVFVGALDYRPNVDGVCWFCQEVWPAIRRRRPDAKIYLVGRQPAAAVRRLAQISGVDVVGQVPDVRPHLARAAVAIAPLRIARGIQNKVLEALAMAKPVVASRPALQGLRAEPGVHLLAASSPDEWVDSILRLFASPSLCQQLGSAGRLFVEARHRWDRCLEPFEQLLGLVADSASCCA